MKRFSFKLEKILNLREFSEKQAKEELARVISEANRINLELKEIAEARIISQKNKNNTFDINSLRSIEFYANRLDLRKEELFEELSATELIIEQKRSLFIEAMKNRKVISMLKEKKEKVWHAETVKEQESIIDDIVNIKHL